MRLPRLHSQGLTLDKVEIALDGATLIKVSASIAPGKVLTLMGESGSGKSSLLDYVAGFLKPAFTASGRILLDGKEITCLPPQDRHVGLMFQSPLLFSHMSVGQNLMFALPPEIRGRRERLGAAEAALKAVGLDGYANRDPATLSGGQQTRVALTRMMLAKPKAMLLDEPFSSLDQQRRAEIRDLVFTTAREKKLPVLLVTHDQEDAEAAEGEIIRL